MYNLWPEDIDGINAVIRMPPLSKDTEMYHWVTRLFHERMTSVRLEGGRVPKIIMTPDFYKNFLLYTTTTYVGNNPVMVSWLGCKISTTVDPKVLKRLNYIIE